MSEMEGQAQPASTPDAGSGQAAPVGTWRDALPQEIRGEKTFDSFKGQRWEEVGPVLAKSYLEANKLIGGSVKIPGKDAKPEEIEAFYKKLGRPDKPEEYQWKKPAFSSPDIQWDEGMAKDFLGVAHKLGLNNEQVQNLINWQAKHMESKAIDTRKQVSEAIKGLKEKYGTDYENKLILAERAVKEIGGQPLVDFLEKSQWGNMPVVIETFIKVGELLGEHGLVDGRIAGAPSSEELKEQIDALTLELAKDHRIPNRQEKLDKLQQLHKAYFHRR